MPTNADDTTTKPKFSYRENDDGSVDSICMVCYMTVGTAMSKASLAYGELKHTCQPEDAFRLNSGRANARNGAI